MPDTFHYGFRIVGPCSGERKLIDWHVAFAAYATCEERAHVEREAYLSAFTFGEGFRAHLAAIGSTRGYDGPCFTPWIWFDLDRDAGTRDIDAGLNDARTLCIQLGQRFAVEDDGLLVFYSGSKGFHVGMPTAGLASIPAASPSLNFHRIARCFAENIAAAAGVTIDTGVYDKVRPVRAPNSRHGKTGRHKRRLTVDELLHLSAARIIELAKGPEPFDLPTRHTSGSELSAAWNEAADQVRRQTEAQVDRRAAIVNGKVPATLNRLTLDFIRTGAAQGDRHRVLFSAAANLGEFGCPPPAGSCAADGNGTRQWSASIRSPATD